MHFIKQIIENENFEEPAKEHMDVHKHFYRYSKGEFSGPAIKMKKYSTKITLKGSFEYEDAIQELVTMTAPNSIIDVEGKVVTGRDISDLLKDLNLDWKLEKKTGKAKGYKIKFSDSLKKEKIMEIIETLREHCYLMLNFKIDKYCQVKTDEKLPKPSKKNPIEDDINKRVSFSRGYVETNQNNLELIYDHLLPDFKSELPDDWTDLILTNTYKINDIEIPKDVKNSRMMRIMAIRKGTLVREVECDNQTFTKEYSLYV
ncbi:MAG: hypothetical protein EU541_02290 [Promethearchaeota archaeon]|nr:MAG: hypothetical protein EU541_02290 [Candidatus Lokiarchaeota archaeon]